MTTLSLNLNNPLQERSNAWERGGNSPQEAARLLEQENLMKKLSDVVNQSPFNSPRSTSISSSENSLTQVQVVQIPTTSAPEGIKKGKVQKVKKALKCSCKNGLLIASHFPIFGVISANCSKILLARKIKKTADTEKITQLNKRVDQYRIASIASALLTVALAVGALVVGLLMGGFALIIGLSVAATALAIAIPLVTYDSVQLHRSMHKGKVPGTEPENKPQSPRKPEVVEAVK